VTKAPIGIVFYNSFRTQQLERFAHRHPAGIELFGQFGLPKAHPRRHGSPRDQGSQFPGDLGGNTASGF
jgi:hypothetical protein